MRYGNLKLDYAAQILTPLFRTLDGLRQITRAGLAPFPTAPGLLGINEDSPLSSLGGMWKELGRCVGAVSRALSAPSTEWVSFSRLERPGEAAVQRQDES